MDWTDVFLLYRNEFEFCVELSANWPAHCELEYGATSVTSRLWSLGRSNFDP